MSFTTFIDIDKNCYRIGSRNECDHCPMPNSYSTIAQQAVGPVLGKSSAATQPLSVSLAPSTSTAMCNVRMHIYGKGY